MNTPHPKPHPSGRTIVISTPSAGTSLEAWSCPDSLSTVIPGGTSPAQINGLEVKVWNDFPKTKEDWERVAADAADVSEPEFVVPHELNAAAGVIILEPDARVWLVHPTNQFAGYAATFPKGTIEDGYSSKATAIKECFEESGLQVRIVGWLGDYVRTASFTRYYLAERVDGNPADMGWESQAVSLVPAQQLRAVATATLDKPVIDSLMSYLMTRTSEG